MKWYILIAVHFINLISVYVCFRTRIQIIYVLDYFVILLFLFSIKIRLFKIFYLKFRCFSCGSLFLLISFWVLFSRVEVWKRIGIGWRWIWIQCKILLIWWLYFLTSGNISHDKSEKTYSLLFSLLPLFLIFWFRVILFQDFFMAAWPFCQSSKYSFNHLFTFFVLLHFLLDRLVRKKIQIGFILTFAEFILLIKRLFQVLHVRSDQIVSVAWICFVTLPWHLEQE